MTPLREETKTNDVSTDLCPGVGFSASLRAVLTRTRLQSLNLIQLFGVEVPVESIHLILEDVVQTHKDRVHRRQTRLLVRSDVTCMQMPAYFRRSSKYNIRTHICVHARAYGVVENICHHGDYSYINTTLLDDVTRAPVRNSQSFGSPLKHCSGSCSSLARKTLGFCARNMRPCSEQSDTQTGLVKR